MLKSILLVGAVAIAAPALAQEATPPASTNAAQPETTAAPAPAEAATDAAASTAAQPATEQAPATASANPSNAVSAVIESDWAKYDADSNGSLSKEEFGAWMTALREQNPAQKAQVTDVNAWTAAAFAMADKDKNGGVTRPELEGFLKG